jgi:pyruvate-formate lyase-activating enzyme
MIPHSGRFDLELEKLQWAQDNKHICVIPYVESQIGAKTINPCCKYDQGFKETWSLDSIRQSTITIKNNIESAQIDKNCNFCHQQESNNQISDRIRSLLQYSSQDINEFLTNKKVQEHTDYLTFSNECNMACRMCTGGCSSLYGSIWDNKKQTVKNLSDNLEYWEYIQADIRQKIHDRGEVYRITVMGGEGTIQKDLYKLTEWLVNEKLSDQVHLQIGTNGSIYHDEIFTQWCKNFKQLSFAISVDSANVDNFPYVRYPAKFEKISRNLQNFKELSAQYSNFSFYLTPTFYINNIAYLKDFLDYFEDFDSESKCLAIRDNTLTRPTYLKLSSLPNYIKTQLVDQINKYININNYSLIERNPMFKISIDNMLEQLHISDFSTAIWKQYLSTTARWDRLTKTDIAFHNKRLWDLFNDEDKSLYQQYKSNHD